MNYTLQLHGERVVYPVPSGLHELMSDIAREVLRDQPTMLYKYIANYLETLIKVKACAVKASNVLEEIIDENQKLLAYVISLGLSLDEANSAASKIQRSFRTHKSRKLLKTRIEEQMEQEQAQKTFQGFQDYLKTLDIDYEDANRASILIQNAYKTYKALKQLKVEKKSVSTHTIDDISPKRLTVEPLDKRKPVKRNSKLLTYQESPSASVESTWSTLARQLAEEERRKKQLAQETDATTSTSATKSSSSSIGGREGRFSLPSYYDENKPGVPMISISGQLIKDLETDILTLYSTDSIDDDKKYLKEVAVKHPSLSNLSLHTKPDLAKELYDIIERRSSHASRFMQLPEPLDEEVKKEVEEAVKMELSKISTSGNFAEIYRTSSKLVSSMSKSSKSHISKSGSVKLKVDFVDEPTESL